MLKNFTKIWQTHHGIKTQNLANASLPVNIFILECRGHFYSRYLDGGVGRVTWAGSLERFNDATEHTAVDVGPLSPGSAGKLPIPHISSEESSLLGYMPNRDDFERVRTLRSYYK